MKEILMKGIIIVGMYILFAIYLLFASYRIERLEHEDEYEYEKVNVTIRYSE